MQAARRKEPTALQERTHHAAQPGSRSLLLVFPPTERTKIHRVRISKFLLLSYVVSYRQKNTYGPTLPQGGQAL